MAMAALRKGDERGALQHVDAALACWRTSRLLCIKADIHVHQGQYDSALACCEEVLQEFPANASAHYFRGLAYKHLGKQSEAMESFRLAFVNGESRAADELRRLETRVGPAEEGRQGGE
jgi:tetratricopeptide (TPR) repeat protein